ncbi:inactive transglutaminase family protein [uncultured Umboniibacter sp.]|uniref:inactive transglutaminase family protein n=1 Tax=uncultured Umboniibacter sp. TaxID=1798917 RepID=UPI0026389741|nr:inactive transglutaminase family protein [uncultured Umboniibacter sp.]
MSSRTPFYFAIFALIVVGLFASWNRHAQSGLPLLPNHDREVWEIEARVEFTALDRPVLASLALPEANQPGFRLIREASSSPDYGMTYQQTPFGRRAEWSKRVAVGEQALFYRAQFLVDPTKLELLPPEFPLAAPKLNLIGPERLAAESIKEAAFERSSNALSFGRELVKLLNDPNDQNRALLRNHYSQLDILSTLLSEAEIANRLVGVLSLEDGRRRQPIERMLQFWTGAEWLLFDPSSQQFSTLGEVLIWDASIRSLLDVNGGRLSRVSFSMISQDVTPTEALASVNQTTEPWNLSIHSLPLEQQTMFKSIMLIPVGALIVAFLRIMVGLKTSGTFMPILIAMAFVQTELKVGIIGLVVIVGVGLVIRGYLSRLNLLLVSRISAVIIAVILMISSFAVVAYHLNLTQGLSITLFPMIILAWTIERMSILWEEDGWREVAMQFAGSLLTAVIVYLAMTNDVIRYLSFNFIGLQLVILAFILLLGNYTGYRLSELTRFYPLGGKS